MADIWEPKYALTNTIVNGLTGIEAARTIVETAPIPPAVLTELSRQAKIRATHYSTCIEGNRLTLDETRDVVIGRRKIFHGRERDVAEVRNYWDALSFTEEQASMQKPVTEEIIRRIQAAVMHGKRVKDAPYRTGQNVIRDSLTDSIVYMPPEAQDVPSLMAQLVRWIERAEAEGVPTAVIAGLAHYQFATIHPYYDGNGRTARLIATYILHRHGYGLKGIFSLEEYHSRDIEAYYNALDIGDHHNYYMGRSEADLTNWLEYFIRTLSAVFESAREEALRYVDIPDISEPQILRRLDHRTRIVYALFAGQDYITSADVANVLGLSERMARIYLAEWTADGWIRVADPSKRGRKYELGDSDG